MTIDMMFMKCEDRESQLGYNYTLGKVSWETLFGVNLIYILL